MKENKGQFKKGHKGYWLGKKRSSETRKKISEGHTGQASPMKGTSRSEEFKNKCSESSKGQVPWNKGLKNDPRVLAGVAKGAKKIRGENNPNWNGGSSFENYPSEFNRSLKKQIKERDRYRCQECFRNAEEARLEIHHIDYNKYNNDRSNLITLCHSCHSQTNFGREEWTAYYQDVIKYGR